jgi:microtubule-associated protein-like 6
VHSVDAASPEVAKTGELKVVSTVKHGSKVPGKAPWVQDVKISPDAKLVAFGVHGGNSNVELATVDAKSLRLRHTRSIDVAMHSALLHLDWSQDSRLLALNSQAYELLFLDVAAERAETASAVKDVAWNTWTCKFGFPVQGIWPGVDYTDVNAVARSHSARVLATAEDSGLVKLFQYPCTQPKAAWKENRGHSSHVTRVVFSAQDRYLVSVGGNDKTVLIWETDFGTENAKAVHHEEEPVDEAEDDDEDELAHEEDLVDQGGVLRAQRQARHEERKQAAMNADEDADDQEASDLFQKYEDNNGDELLAAKPWKG